MAIVQASLAEDILSRQERAVMRGIYRAQQLAEALNALEKIQASMYTVGISSVGKPSVTKDVDNLKAYFAKAISNALASTKIPAAPSEKVITSTPVAQT